MAILNCGGNPSESLPDPTSANAGDVLTLDNNKDAVWQTPSKELPATTSATAGDVLTLDSNKDAVWQTPSGGGVTIREINGIADIYDWINNCKLYDQFVFKDGYNTTSTGHQFDVGVMTVTGKSGTNTVTIKCLGTGRYMTSGGTSYVTYSLHLKAESTSSIKVTVDYFDTNSHSTSATEYLSGNIIVVYEY